MLELFDAVAVKNDIKLSDMLVGCLLELLPVTGGLKKTIVPQ